MNRLAPFSLMLSLAACGTGSSDGALPAPTEVTVRAAGNGLSVSWKDNSTDEDEFAIERKTTGSFGVVGSAQSNAAQYQDDAVTPGTTYVYRLRAVKAGLYSAFSTEVSGTAPSTDSGGGAGGGSGGGAGGGSGGGATSQGGTGGGGGGGSGGGVLSTLPDGGYSLQQHIVPILNASCGAGTNSCHSRVAYGPTPAGGCRGWLALENVPLGSRNPTNNAMTGCPDRSLWERLTELDAWMCEPNRKRYVTPNSLSESQLYQAVAGDPGGGGACNKMPGVPLARMPPSPAPELTPAEKNKLATWILQGAPNN